MVLRSVFTIGFAWSCRDEGDATILSFSADNPDTGLPALIIASRDDRASFRSSFAFDMANGNVPGYKRSVVRPSATRVHTMWPRHASMDGKHAHGVVCVAWRGWVTVIVIHGVILSFLFYYAIITYYTVLRDYESS